MRTPLLLRTPLKRLIASASSALALVSFWTFPLKTALAEETADSRASRLGFRFDRKTHDAAVAADTARRAGTTLDIEATPDGVIRLPKHVVTADRVPLEENEILTPKGRVELAKKRHLSPMYQKTVGPLAAIAGLIMNPLGGWNPNGPEAMALYEDNQNTLRKKRLNELEDLAELAEWAKKAETKAAPADDPNSSKPRGKSQR